MAKIYKLKPSQRQAEDAVRVLMAWAGDDPGRQGLEGYPGKGRASLQGVVQGLRGGS